MTVTVVGFLFWLLLSLLSPELDEEEDDEDTYEDEDVVDKSSEVPLLEAECLRLRRFRRLPTLPDSSSFPAFSRISLTIFCAVSVSPDLSFATGAPGIGTGGGGGRSGSILLFARRFRHDPFRIPPGGLTFSQPYGQCRQRFPQQRPLFKWVSSLKTMNPVAGSM